MKTNHTINFILILTGAFLMASGDRLIRSEFAFCLGIVILMFGVYKISATLNSREVNGGDEDVKGE
jgi:hypothetical protein